MKRVLSLLLVIFLATSLIVPARASYDNLTNFTEKNSYFPNQFKDVPSTLWCHDNVEQVYKLGLMLGNTATTFNPTGCVTEAQALVIAARIHKIYTTGNDDFSEIKQEMNDLEPQILEWCGYDTNNSGYKEFYEAWYSPYVYYLCYHTGGDCSYPIYPMLGSIPDQAPFIDGKYPLSRERFAYYMAHSLPESEFQKINTVDNDAIPDMAYEQSPEVYQLYRAGVIIGSDSAGTFNPSSNITRGAVAAIVTRIVNPNLRQFITLKNEINSSKDMITLSQNNLKIKEQSTVSITAYYNENDYPDGLTINAYYDTTIVDVEWGDWQGMTTTLKITPVSNGTTIIKVNFLEAPNEYKDIIVEVYGQTSGTHVEISGADNSAYITLARDGYYQLYSLLKNPASLQVNGIYGGQGNMFYGNTYRDVVIIDYSAMNGFGGYSRSYFMVWRSDYGELCYDNQKYYSPSSLKESKRIAIEDIL